MMRAALVSDHDDVVRTAIEAHAGRVFKHTGDGVCVGVHFSPRAAVEAAVDRPAGTGITGPDGDFDRGGRAAGVGLLRVRCSTAPPG